MSNLDEELGELLGEASESEEEPSKKTVVKKSVAKKSASKKSAAEKSRPNKKHKYKIGETRHITVQKSKEKGGDRPVPVNYNGKLFTVPRGVKVEVPAPVAEILMNAEETIYHWDGEKTHVQEALSYPTSILS